MKPYNKDESKRIQVRRMFNNIAPYYDKICHILSFNIDRLWRKQLVKLITEIKPTHIVDIATGAGDVAISLAKKIPTSQIVGIDLSEEMLKVAQQKIERLGVKSNIRLLCEDAENLSLPSNSFDVATISFGIRNFENTDKGLSEFYRILREGGSLFVMEFSTPKHKVFNVLYHFYSKYILPVIGQVISKDNKAYSYLPESIVEFYQDDEFTELLQNNSFDNCTAISLTNGIAHIYIGVAVCIASGIATMAMYWYINAVVLKDPRLYDPTQVKSKKKKEKVGIMDGIKILCKSKYLLMICAIVLCYGMGINFFEIVWKKYSDGNVVGAAGVSDMMANLSMLTGTLTIVASFIGQNILRRTKWKTAALVPASILTIFGGIFFVIVLYGEYVSPTIFGMNFAVLAMWFGLIQDALSKSVKYCLFDATKNMAYMPLDEDTRTKGQAAVEVIGGRAGKAGASAIGMVLTSVIAAGSVLTDHVVTISVLFGTTVTGWIGSVFNLSKKYETKMAEQSKAKEA